MCQLEGTLLLAHYRIGTLFKYFQSVFQELDIVGNTFVECIRRTERFAFGIQQDVERLGICTEFAALQIAPFVTDCFQLSSLAVLFDRDWLW